MANQAAMVIPSDGDMIIQERQAATDRVIQMSGRTNHGNPMDLPEKNQCARWLEDFIKMETKTLGAIQIMIGLIHITLGSVTFVITVSDLSHLIVLVPIALYGGYPFWGAIFFIVSGSLSVIAGNYVLSHMVICNVGMNITSAVFTCIGTIAFIVELAMYSKIPSERNGRTTAPGICLSTLFFLFTLLELCITISIAHVGCKAACRTEDETTDYMANIAQEDGALYATVQQNWAANIPDVPDSAI